MTDLDSTINRLEKRAGQAGMADLPQCLFYLGILQFLRGALETDRKNEATISIPGVKTV